MRNNGGQMSEATVGLIVMCATALVASVISHILITRAKVAILVAGTAAAALFQLFSYLHLGHLDKFFCVAVVVSWGYALAIAAVVAIPFRWLRKTTPPKTGQCQKCGYDLTGNVSGRCPECGTLVTHSSPPSAR
jgi:hypothetical protein